MRKLSKILLGLILFFLCTNLVNAQAAGVCCYNGGTGIYAKWGASSCGEGEVIVSGFENGNYECDFQRKGCVIDTVCYATVLGDQVFNLDEVKNYFTSTNSISIDSYCENLRNFDNTCAGDYTHSGYVPSGDNNGGTSTSGTGTEIDATDYEINQSNINATAQALFCADAGGPFGFFVSKSSCEELESCLYNPYLSGHIGILSSGIEELQPMEGACVPKVSIKTCYDYKTKDNCDANVIYTDPRYSKENLQSCKWIPTSNFYNGFSTDSGICISDAVEENKHFNIEGYANRGNLIQNPSFEKGNSDWSGSLSINTDKTTYDGSHNAFLAKGNSIEQKIEFFDVGVTYSFILYIQGDKSFSNNTDSTIVVEIIEYDKNNILKTTTSYPMQLAQYNKNGIFQKVVFQAGGHKLDPLAKKINFKITTDEDIVIDAVHFGKYDEIQIKTNGEIFYPTELIHSSASICNECFSDFNMNFCTSEKSDLLGDCSYMVEGPENSYSSDLDMYLGKGINPYLENDWHSQSIAGSKVFCELYLTQEVCEDPHNYINTKYLPFHSKSNSQSLCKWDQMYGCFKDSDNSAGPDTMNSGLVFLRGPSNNINKKGFDSSAFDGFSETDFTYACDSLPPISYIYFSAKDLNKTQIYLTSDKSELIGDVRINLEAYDISQEACEQFSLPNSIYIDYVINNQKAHYRVSETSTLTDYYSVKEYFVDGAGNQLLSDGINKIDMIVKDQSGNIGKVKKFNFNMDLNAPNVTLNNYDVDPPAVFGPGKILEFEIYDKSSILGCTFNLTPYSSNIQIDHESYLTGGDFFNLSGVTDFDGSSGTFNFPVPIYNTSANADLYDLTITCEDIFGQIGIYSYPLYADYDTNLVLMEPLSFRHYLFDIGYLNGETNVWAISTDKKLSSCEFLDLNNGASSLVVNPIASGFNVSSYSGVEFYSNISGTIKFNSDGKKDVVLECRDELGNTFAENIVYYYDTQKPSLKSYELIGSEIGGEKSLIELDGKYYTRQISQNSYILDSSLNLTLDGTGSWISENINLNIKNFNILSQNGTQLQDGKITVSPEIELDNESFIANVYFSGFANLMLYSGIETQEKNLYLHKYELNYSDKAKNQNLDTIDFYFDSSKPSFKFQSEVFVGKNNVIFTKVNDPNFEVSFNTPSYRKFNCDIDLIWGFLNYKKTFDFANKINFKLSDLAPEFTLDSNKHSASFILSCVDEYGVVLNEEYDLEYDNTAPNLYDVNLDNYINGIYLVNREGVELGQIITDKLVFDFIDTNEVGYNCQYEFSSSDYNCKDEIYSSNFSVVGNSLTYKTQDLDLISDSAATSICYRKDNFNTLLKQYRENNNEILKTKISYKAYCKDTVELETKIIEKEININYISGTQFADFDFDVNNDVVTFIVKSLAPFTKVSIANNFDGTNEVLDLGGYVEYSGGVYIYKGDFPIPANYEGGYYTYWALGKDSEDNIWDRINGQLTIDKTNPTIDVFFPDLSDDGFMYSEEFEIIFNVKDLPVEFGELSRVIVNLDGNEIYNSKELNNIDKTHLNDLDMSKNYYSSNNLNYYGDIVFKNAQMGQNYDFEFIGIDKYGNSILFNQSVEIRDGVSIRLMDSSNAVVDSGGFSLLTKVNSPELSFKTTRTVEKCMVYPFIGSQWINITSNDNIGNEFASLNNGDVVNNLYKFDLSTFARYDLSKTDESSSFVKIVCIYNNTAYNYSRNILKMDLIPDYVLSSSNGFVLNDEPYETTINVKSVGAHKYITCKYSINDNSPIEFSNKDDITFQEVISFSDLGSGTHYLDLSCINKLGTKGPDKRYNFIINKGIGVDISDVTLINSNGREYLPNTNNDFIVDKLSGIGLKFITNKQNLACSYEYGKAGGIIHNIINFFKSLFTDNLLTINANDNPFEFFDAGKITLEDTGTYNLLIQCSDSSSNTIEKEYTIEYRQTSGLDNWDLELVN